MAWINVEVENYLKVTWLSNAQIDSWTALTPNRSENRYNSTYISYSTLYNERNNESNMISAPKTLWVIITS